jgi:hypothetical protein
MKKRGHLGFGLALTSSMLIGSAAAANAAPVLFTLVGEDDDLSATVSFSYVGLTESTGRVDVTLTNTSGAYDPRLTGFAFNLPDAVDAIDAFTTSLSRWQSDFAPDDIDTPGRFGFFDAAALTGSNFNGGSPRKGLARNATADFSFVLAGTGMLGLSESAFLNLGSRGAAGEAGTVFAARFQQVGLGGERSDVATPSGPPTASVSEPATLLLSGLGFLGIATLRRRRRA